MILILFGAASGYAQNSHPAPAPIYSSVEQMPVYQDGGNAGLQRFVATHYRLPHLCDWRPASPLRFVVSFVVDTTGRATGPVVLQGLADYERFQWEAGRVIGMLGQFTPGRQHNRLAAVRLSIPFSIETR